MAFNAQQNDTRKFTEGTWLDLFGARWKVARAGNPRYLEAVEKHGKRHAQTKADEQRALMLAIAEGILLDWDDVVDANEEAIPYSTHNAADVLSDNPELVNALLAEANRSENYRREDIDAQAKKPQTPSSTA